jgi:molybdate transport system ATP-binding protein
VHIGLTVRRGAFEAAVDWRTDARVSGLYGPTGCGKTSLLLAIAGILPVGEGRLEIGGTVLFDAAKNLRLPPEKRRLGVVFQDGRLFPHLTVAENLEMGRAAPTATGPDRDEVIALLDLAPLLERRPHELSGGQTRLVAVGRALLMRPRLLLLDEPLTGLDPERRRRVLAYLLRLKESFDIRMLYVSHVFSDFLALVDEMVVLGAGGVRAAGSPTEVMGIALGDAGAGPVETTVAGRVTAARGDEVIVDCRGTPLVLGMPEHRIGAEAYVTVAAHDVLLAAGEVPPTSARNVLRGVVTELRPAHGRLLVAVDVGPTLWAEITEPSREVLRIEPGREVSLLVKASALRGVALPGPSPAAPPFPSQPA